MIMKQYPWTTGAPKKYPQGYHITESQMVQIATMIIATKGHVYNDFVAH